MAIAGGGEHTITLLEDSTVGDGGIHNQTNVPAGLTNVVAVAAGSLIVSRSALTEQWLPGERGSWSNNVPVDLTNVVAIAAGEQHSLALQANGNLIVLGTNPPSAPEGLLGIAATLDRTQPSVPTGYRSYGMCPGRLLFLF